MTPRHQPHRPVSARRPPAPNASLGGGLLLALGVTVLLVVASYPLQAAVLVAGLAVAVGALRIGGPAVARALEGRVTELDVPGIGSVQIRVTPR